MLYQPEADGVVGIDAGDTILASVSQSTGIPLESLFDQKLLDQVKDFVNKGYSVQLPALDSSMITPTGNGYYQISNEFVDSFVKAILNSIPQSEIDSNPQLKEEISQVSEQLLNYLNALQAKIEIHTAGWKINGMKVSVQSTPAFFEMIRSDSQNNLTCVAEILLDANTGKPEKIALDLNVCDEYDPLTQQYSNELSLSVLLTRDVLKVSLIEKELNKRLDTLPEATFCGDETVKLEIDLDLSAIGTNNKIIRTFSSSETIENVTQFDNFGKQIEKTDSAYNQEIINDYLSSNTVTGTDARPAAGVYEMTFVSTRNNESTTVFITVYNGILPETFQPADDANTATMKVLLENRDLLMKVDETLRNHVDALRKNAEATGTTATIPTYFVTLGDTYVLLLVNDNQFASYVQKTAPNAEAVEITVTQANGEITVTIP